MSTAIFRFKRKTCKEHYCHLKISPNATVVNGSRGSGEAWTVGEYDDEGSVLSKSPWDGPLGITTG